MERIRMTLDTHLIAKGRQDEAGFFIKQCKGFIKHPSHRAFITIRRIISIGIDLDLW